MSERKQAPNPKSNDSRKLLALKCNRLKLGVARDWEAETGYSKWAILRVQGQSGVEHSETLLQSRIQ